MWSGDQGPQESGRFSNPGPKNVTDQVQEEISQHKV